MEDGGWIWGDVDYREAKENAWRFWYGLVCLKGFGSAGGKLRTQCELMKDMETVNRSI